ncbi:MAG: hypothetical protein DELT_00194 [Desulfovibrio sp.]
MLQKYFLSAHKRESSVHFFSVLLLACWTTAIGVSASYTLSRVHDGSVASAKILAHAAFEKDVLYHTWNTSHSGGYVSSVQGALSGVRSDILDAANALDMRAPLVTELTTLNGKPYLRYVRQIPANPSCVRCHGKRGYRPGDPLGALSVSVPMSPFYVTAKPIASALWASHAALWLLGASGIFCGARVVGRRMGRVMERTLTNTATVSKTAPKGRASQRGEKHFTLKSLVMEAIEPLPLAAAAKGLTITRQLDPTLPQMVYGDSARILRALRCLLEHTIRSTEKGEVRLAVTATACGTKEALVLFSVTGACDAVPPERRNHVSTAFARSGAPAAHGAASRAPTHEVLPCVDILARMGSALRKEHTPGVGSVYSFSLFLPTAETGKA